MKSIKEFISEHKKTIIIVGGVIVVGTIVVLAKKEIASNLALEKEGREIMKALSDADNFKIENLDIDGVIKFVKDAGETLQYAIFKEGPHFNIINL